MKWDLILLNLYYAGNAIAFLIRDILWLRFVMILAGFCMIVRGAIIQNNVIIAWISLFTLINIFQIVQLIMQRRDVKLPDNLREFFGKTFNEMNKREFLRFWGMGYDKQYKPGERILNDSQKAEYVYYIQSGTANVVKNDKKAANLKSYSFIGEMSFLTDKTVSADVTAETALLVRIWDQKRLNRLNHHNHNIYNKFHLILSRDLIDKLQKYL